LSSALSAGGPKGLPGIGKIYLPDAAVL
jgi:hypothetical protein